jgi:DNA primase
VGFPDAFVEEVRRTADLVRFISDHVALKKMGTSWKGLCPFHKEKTPSFNVNPDRGFFHCFGCGEGGDVFKFAMLHDKLSFPEAVEAVARRFGLQVPERRFEPEPERKEREELLGLLEAASEHFRRNFAAAAGSRAREYLLGRGFRPDTLERIRAGAALDSWGDLLESLKRRFPVPLMMTAGLVLEGQKGRPYDRFRNRVVFPILNDQGKTAGFGARSLDGSEPKYLNSPESPVYQKSRTLYGLSWAREPIRKAGRVVLMEGYLDVARALEAGVEEVVATCGTALTPGHARLLRRFTEQVVVNFDQDAAGQRAAHKSLEILLEEGLRVCVVELPAGHDPDTFLKAEGADAYRRRLEEAPSFMDWLIRRAAAENEMRTPAGKAAYLNALLPVLARIENAVERAAWLPAIVERGGLDERAAQEELRRALATRATSVALPAQGARGNRPVAQLLPAEKYLLALIMEGAEAVPEALRGLEDEDVASLRTGGVLRAARDLAAEGGPVTMARLLERASEEEKGLLTRVGASELPTEGVDPGACVKELKAIPLKARMAQIQKDLAGATGDAQEALLAEKLRLGRAMADLGG